MASQLTRNQVRAMLASDAPVVRMRPQHVVLAGLFCIAVTYAALLVGIRTARSEEDLANRRYTDTVALLEAPPGALDDLQAQVDAAKAQLALAQAGTDPATLDPASDAVTELLIRRAQGSGAVVAGVARVDTAQSKIGGVPYDVQAVRISLEGSTAQIVTFLAEIHVAEPQLIPSLSSLSVEGAVSKADIVFSVYAPVPATPVAPAAATPAPR